MPQLSSLPSRLQIQPFQPINPASYFDRTPLPTPVINTTSGSAAAGKAALFGSIAKVLADLPDTLTKAYKTGRESQNTENVQRDYSTVASGGKLPSGADLSDFQVSPEGDISFKPQDHSLEQAKLDYYKNRAVKAPVKPLYDQELESLGVKRSDIKAPIEDVEPALPVKEEPSTPDFQDTGLPSPDEGASEGPLSLIPAGSPIPGLDTAMAAEAQQPAIVEPARQQAISDAAGYAAGQLSDIEPSELSASGPNGAPVPAASVTPAQATPKPLDGFGTPVATPVAAPLKSTKTVDPITGVITATTSDGRTLQLFPGGKAYKEVKPAAAEKIPVALQVEMARSGYDYTGQTPKEAITGWKQHLQGTETIAPHLLPAYTSWRNRLKNTDPLVKQYYTAKHESNAIESALSSGLTPAAALGAIDGYIKAMRGGAATQGMTKILKEGQTLSQNLKLKWQNLTGGANTNAVLTPEMASDIQKIVKKVKQSAEAEIQDQKEGDKEYWSSIGVPAASVEKAYKAILSERKTSADTSESPVAHATPVAGGKLAVSPQDAEAVSWLKANPTHPKAAAVKSALQAKGIAVE